MIYILKGVASSNCVNAYEHAKQVQFWTLSATDARSSVSAPHACAACSGAAQPAERCKTVTYIGCAKVSLTFQGKVVGLENKVYQLEWNDFRGQI